MKLGKCKSAREFTKGTHSIATSASFHGKYVEWVQEGTTSNPAPKRSEAPNGIAR
jgi:hypothetical protein